MGLFDRGDDDADSAELIARAQAILDENDPDVARARELLERARAAGDGDALAPLGYIAYGEGDEDGAIALWQEGAQAGVPTAMGALGIHFYLEGDLDTAVDWLERAAAGGYVDAAVALAETEGRRGNRDRARTVLEDLIDEHDFPLITCGFVARSYGDSDLALELFTRAADEGDSSAMIEVGLILSERGDRDAALAEYERAAAAGNTLGLYNVGATLEQAGDRDAARRKYEEGAAASGSECVRALGVMRIFEGDREGATAFFQQAVELGDEDALRQLSTTLRELGRFDEARQWAQRIVDVGDPEGLSILGSIFEAAGDQDTAHDLYRQAAEQGDPVGAYNYGQALAKEGDYDTARALFEIAVEGNIAEAANALGAIAEETGETDEALDWYARSAEQGYDVAAENLAKLRGISTTDHAEPLDFTGPPLGAAGIALEQVDTESLGEVVPGNQVKLHLTVAYPGGSEYIWCEVVSVDDDAIIGRLVNILTHDALSEIRFGQPLRFRHAHVIENRAESELAALEFRSPDGLQSVELMHPDGRALGLDFALMKQLDDGEIVELGALCALAALGTSVRAATLVTLLFFSTDPSWAMQQLALAASSGNADALALHDDVTSALREAPDRDAATLIREWLSAHGEAFSDEIGWLIRAADGFPDEYAADVGTLLLYRGDEAAAERILVPAAQGGNIRCALWLAPILRQRGDGEGAARLYREAADGGFHPALTYLAVTLNDLGRREEASAAMREAILLGDTAAEDEGFRLGLIAVDESDPEDLERFGAINARFGNTEEALRLLRAGEDKGNAECAFLLALLHDGRGESLEAVAHAERAFELGRSATWEWLYNTALADDDGERAELWMRRAIAEYADSEAACSLARHLIRAGRFGEAASILEEPLASSDDEVVCESMVEMTLLRWSEGKRPEALEWAQRLADRGDARGFYMLGSILGEDDPAAVRPHYALAAAYGHGPAMVWVARHEAADGNLSEATTWLERAALGDEVDAILVLAELARETGDTSQAARRLRQAADLGNAEAMRELSGMLREQDPAAAAELLEQAAAAGDGIAARLRWVAAYEEGDPSWESLLGIAVELADPPSLLAAGLLIADDNLEAAHGLVRHAVEEGLPLDEMRETMHEEDLAKLRRMGFE